MIFRLLRRVMTSMSLAQLRSGSIFPISMVSLLRSGDVGTEATYYAWKGNWSLSCPWPEGAIASQKGARQAQDAPQAIKYAWRRSKRVSAAQRQIGEGFFGRLKKRLAKLAPEGRITVVKLYPSRQRQG